MPQLLLATRNNKKKTELQQLLSKADLTLLTLNDIKEIPEIVEDGSSFEENAIKKARETAAWSGYVCLADDSGLVVDVLNGQPGIFSARFAGEDATDESNNEKLLDMMRGIEEGCRTARFVCVIAISTPDGKTETVCGCCEGRIALAPGGSEGFGYDPLFIPVGYDKSFGELPAQIKNTISHRAVALARCVPKLEKLLG
jgi:XTP/dITP diphosphohydrolase